MYKKLSIAALTKAWWSIFSLTITCWQLLIIQITLYALLCWLLFNFGDSQKPKWPHWANVRILFFKGCVSVVLVGSIWFPSRGNLSPSVPTDDHVRMSSRNKQETLCTVCWCLLHICNYVKTSWALHCANSFFHALLCTEYANFAPAQFINAAHYQSLLMVADNLTMHPPN